jgi:hypothetical protein
VPGDTPASRATSRIVTEFLRDILNLDFGQNKWLSEA